MEQYENLKSRRIYKFSKYEKDLFEDLDIKNIKIIITDNDGILTFYLNNGKFLGEVFVYGNIITWIITINYNGKLKIKGMGSYMIFKILSNIKSDRLIISNILEDTLGFYQKVAERFLMKGYIKKYEFTRENNNLILYK